MIAITKCNFYFNDRMVEFERDLWRSSCPKHLPKYGHLEQGTQDHVQKAPEYLKGWRLHNPSRKPVSVLGDPHRKKKK